MKPNAIHYLSLARKAGRIEVGEEPTGAAARAGHARLVVVASDAPGNTLRRAKNFVAGTDQQMVVLPFTKDEMGEALGRTVVALAAITDPAMALALLKAMEDDARYGPAMEVLTRKAERLRRHQQEQKAHERNLRKGKGRKKEQNSPAEPEKKEPGKIPVPDKALRAAPHPYSRSGTKEKKPFQKKFDSEISRGPKPAGKRAVPKPRGAGSYAAGHRFGRKTHGGAEE